MKQEKLSEQELIEALKETIEYPVCTLKPKVGVKPLGQKSALTCKAVPLHHQPLTRTHVELCFLVKNHSGRNDKQDRPIS